LLRENTFFLPTQTYPWFNDTINSIIINILKILKNRMKNLVGLNLARLQNLEVGQHVKGVLKGIADLESGLITDANFLNYYARLGEASVQFDKAMLKITKSDETLKITNADALRDKAITAFQRQLSVYELSEDETEIEAFNSLNTVMKTYKNLQRWNLEEETNGIDNFLDELASAKYAAHIATLNMQNFKDRIKSSNEKFKIFFNSRTNEQVNTEYYDTKTLRDELTDQYNLLAEYTLTLSKALDTEAFNKPLDVFNIVRKYYADLLAKRKGTKKGEEEEPIPPME
jgi:uncharacterized protein (DUF4213/DUF364 family)